MATYNSNSEISSIDCLAPALSLMMTLVVLALTIHSALAAAWANAFCFSVATIVGTIAFSMHLKLLRLKITSGQ